MDALLRGCRRAVRGFIMAVLAQIMAVLRRPSLAQLHLETSRGGEPAKLVRLSLYELSLQVIHRCSPLFQYCRCFFGPALRKSRSAQLEGASLAPALAFPSLCLSKSLDFCRSRSWWADKVWLTALAVCCSVGYRIGYGLPWTVCCWTLQWLRILSPGARASAAKLPAGGGRGTMAISGSCSYRGWCRRLLSL